MPLGELFHPRCNNHWECRAIETKKVIVFDKDQKSRHIIDILCRKLGCVDIVDVELQEVFDLEVAKTVDKYGGMGGLLGKSALPKISVNLFILDWDSPKGGAPTLIKSIKARFTGMYRFLVVADKRHAAEMGVAMKAGATDFILKPFSLSEFKEKMDNVLSAKPLTVSSFNLTQPPKEAPKGVPKAPAVSAPAWGAKPAVAPAAQPSVPPNATQIKPKFPPMAQQPAAGAGKGGGPSFYTATAKRRPDKGDAPTATLVDGQIDGHYHEKVDVIGGGENCYWAKEVEGEKVRLDYLSAKGTATGVEAKVIDKEEFLYNYYLCEEYGCQILKRLGKWPPPQDQ